MVCISPLLSHPVLYVNNIETKLDTVRKVVNMETKRAAVTKKRIRARLPGRDRRARSISFRVSPDLDEWLTAEATRLNVTVARVVDNLMRDGLDARSHRERETATARRLEGALARLETLALTQQGRHDLFREEATLVGLAIRECERGEHHLLALINFGLFTDPFHRSAWRRLSVLLDSSRHSDERTTPPDFTRALEAMSQLDQNAPDPFEFVGGVKKYLDLIVAMAKQYEAKKFTGRKAAIAISALAGEAMNKLLNATDPKFEKRFARGRYNFLMSLKGGNAAWSRHVTTRSDEEIGID